jgi:SAM-dependent methyltransferase
MLALLPTLAAVLQGKNLYDALYSAGYHSNATYSHSRPLLRAIARDRTLRSVVDFGCSNGFAVEHLWKTGRTASGYDVSEKAVQLAHKLRNSSHGKCLKNAPCFFSNTTILDLIAAQGGADAVMSSDVLEHVEPADVQATVARLAKVAKRKVFMKVATAREHNRQPIETLAKEDRPVALHATLRPLSWWAQQFERHGFRKTGQMGPDSVELTRVYRS